MFTKLELKNFQSHKETTINFAPGLNAIIGQSDSGKSSILRAIKWLITNRPSGDAFRSYWGGDTNVTLHTTNEIAIIQRFKTAKTNGYLLDNSKYEAIGTGVPDEIAKVLNIDDINFQQQLDRPFLLDDSAGEVAQHFNRIAHLDMIDTSVSYVKAQSRALTTHGTLLSTTIAKNESELCNYEFLPALEKDLIQLEDKKTLTIVLSEKMTKVQQIVTTYTSIARQMAEYKQITGLQGMADDLLKQIDKQKSYIQKIKDVQKAIANIKNCSVSIISIENSLKTKIKEFEEIFPDVCPLCGAVNKK